MVIEWDRPCMHLEEITSELSCFLYYECLQYVFCFLKYTKFEVQLKITSIVAVRHAANFTFTEVAVGSAC